MHVLDLFSGIGGFSLGLERAGFRTAAFCEIDDYCQRILRRHWPHVPIHTDIKQLEGNQYAGQIDLICGGYPCQPFSIAGKRQGEKDPRHLWPEMYRLIREIRPRWVIAENVAGHVDLGLDTVLVDLEVAGYTPWPFIIPACAIGAPHRRDRIWLIAHAPSVRLQRPLGRKQRRHAKALPSEQVWWELPQPFTCGSLDGFPSGVDRLRSLGNSVVPQIPEFLANVIIAYELDLLTQQHEAVTAKAA